MKAKTAFDKNCSFWHSRLAPEVTICPQHLAFSSTGRPYERLQQAAATQFANHPSLQHSHLPKQQRGVKKYWQSTNKERKCPQTIAVEAAGEQINNFSKQDYGAVYVKARMRGP